MHVDALTLTALTGELREELLGARVEEIYQPTPQAIAVQCWGRGHTMWLVASAHPRFARVHVVDRKPQKLVAEPPAFVMLLRKHLEGARITAIQQPAWERVLELGFARRLGKEAGLAPPVWLVAELMGRLSNLVLRDDGGTILGALRLVRAEVNRYRTIAPNEPYISPPPQTRRLGETVLPRLDGAQVTASDLAVAARAMLAGATRKPPRLADLLMAHVRGFSAELGREVAARALQAPDAPLLADLPWETVAREAQALAALAASQAWRPTLVLAPAAIAGTDAGASGGEPMAYAPYEPCQFDGHTLQAMPSMNAALGRYFQHMEWRDAVEGAKGDLRRTLTAHRDRSARKAEALAAELAALADAARLRMEGDVLLAYQTAIAPHVTSFTVTGPLGQGAGEVTIALDPRLSAVENANRRFARYQKLRRAAALIPPQVAANEVERARLEQMLTDLALAETTADIADVRAEVREAGYLRGPRARAGSPPHGSGKSGAGGKTSQTKSGKPGKGSKPGAGKGQPRTGTPMRRQSVDGLTLLVGKNSRQNEEVTFHLAVAGDLWLHARGVPGAHVIVKSAGRVVPEPTLRQAAALAAYYSQSREATSVLVDYTEQRHVRHLKGGGPGLVTYDHERTLHATPADAGA
jgi:predicted ribosome quality control (RQC) complex YloA/Tae2 family protein